VQVSLGFLYLLAGFCLQLYGLSGPSPGLDPSVGTEFPTTWVGLVLLSALALVVLGWWLSQALFRHYVRGYLVRHRFDFETEVKLAREVGELLGLATNSDETVQSYVARLHKRLGLLEPARPGERRPQETRRDGGRDAPRKREQEPEEELV
jgi:hypothetical protein